MAAIPHIDDLTILRTLRDNDYRRSPAAAALGVLCGELRQRVRQMNAAGADIPSDPNFGAATDTGAAYLPTRKRIRQQTAAMRRTWTPYERKKRSGGMDNTLDPLEITEINGSSLRLAPVESSGINYGG